MELTEQHKQTLAGAGIDWSAFLAKVKNALPLLIAIAQILLADKPPVMQDTSEPRSQKECLQCILHQQLQAAHQLCAVICECEESCGN